MRMLALVSAAALLGLGAASAAPRDVGAFNAIRASDQLRVEIATGERHGVDVSGGDASRIITRVDNGELRIRLRARPWFSSPQLDAVVRVTTPGVTAIAASRGVTVRAENIAAAHLSLSASMGADIRISGQCGALQASASMGGSIDARALACETGAASASMGGSARVNTSQALQASASMGGSVNVDGAPAERDSSSSMGGSVSFNRAE